MAQNKHVPTNDYGFILRYHWSQPTTSRPNVTDVKLRLSTSLVTSCSECKPRDKIFKTHKPRGHVVDVVVSVLFWGRGLTSRDRYMNKYIALKIV